MRPSPIDRRSLAALPLLLLFNSLKVFSFSFFQHKKVFSAYNSFNLIYLSPKTHPNSPIRPNSDSWIQRQLAIPLHYYLDPTFFVAIHLRRSLDAFSPLQTDTASPSLYRRPLWEFLDGIQAGDAGRRGGFVWLGSGFRCWS